MKIKIDFISNSSSTSFVYISKEMLSKHEFMAAAGVSEDSPVASLFEDMFYELNDKIKRGKTIGSIAELEELRSSEIITDSVVCRIEKAFEQGQTVTIGSFSSEASLAELLLCTEIFEIESEGFFINAYENYW